jgi:hypothetical protein
MVAYCFDNCNEFVYACSVDLDVTAKITSAREKLGIPSEGLPDADAAVEWYRAHYQEAKGAPLQGGFGYRLLPPHTALEFDYEWDPLSLRFSIGHIPPIDKQVPLDIEVDTLAREYGIDAISVPALRLVLLVGPAPQTLPLIPTYISVAMGGARLLMHPPAAITEELRRQILDETGPFSDGINQGYLSRRRRRNAARYFEVMRAYDDWEAMKRESERQGKGISRKGYLKWMAQRLVAEYGWGSEPDSYTVLRYLQRARMLWDHPFLK